MKTKSLLAAVLLFGGSLLMVFAAAKVETCKEKYDKCAQICANQKENNKMAGREERSYEASYKSCMKSCDKAKADCDKANPQPAKPAPKK